MHIVRLYSVKDRNSTVDVSLRVLNFEAISEVVKLQLPILLIVSALGHIIYYYISMFGSLITFQFSGTSTPHSA